MDENVNPGRDTHRRKDIRKAHLIRENGPVCLCVSCVGPVALCVGRSAASCGPLSVPLSYDIHSLSSVCRSPPLLRCSRTLFASISLSASATSLLVAALGLTRHI